MKPGQPTYAIILTHNRPELLNRCVRAVHPHVDRVIVVDNASDPPAAPPLLDETRPNMVIVDPAQPPNLSTLWNAAFDLVAEEFANTPGEPLGGWRWNLVVLCDDAVVPDTWVWCVCEGMRAHNAAAACTGPVVSPLLKTAPDRDITHRMPGWAFTLAGEKRLRADERLHWWWCDTHLDWAARKAGGMVMLPGPVVVNERPNEFTVTIPELGRRAGADGDAFAHIWGWRPW